MSREERILEQIYTNETDASEYTGFDLQKRLEEIKKSNEEILHLYTAESMEKAVEAKIRENKKQQNVLTNKFSWSAQKVIACAAVLCFALLVPLFLTRENITSSKLENGFTLEQSVSPDRAKGVGSRIYVYKQEGSTAIKLDNRAKINSGDVVQISYVASGAKYGAILSIDGNGVVTQHYPEYGTEAASLDSNGEIPLSYSYMLDDAPSFERFLLITNDSQFSINELIEAVASFQNKARGKDADFSKYLPKTATVTEILLLK